VNIPKVNNVAFGNSALPPVIMTFPSNMYGVEPFRYDLNNSADRWMATMSLKQELENLPNKLRLIAEHSNPQEREELVPFIKELLAGLFKV